MLKDKLCSKKGAAMEWAIIFGFVIFALILLITTTLFSISVKVRFSKNQSRNARNFDQIGEYFVQAVEQGKPFSEIQNLDLETQNFFTMLAGSGYGFSEQCAKKGSDEYYRVLTVRGADNGPLMTLIVKETEGSSKSTKFEIVGRYTGDNVTARLDSRLQDLSIKSSVTDDLSAFLEARNKWHDRCVGNIIECTVSFDLNGASGTLAPITTENRTCTLPAPPSEKSGQIFAGWSDGTNTYLPGASYNPQGENTFVQLTAVWKTKRKITANVNSSSGGTVTVQNNGLTATNPFYVPDGSAITATSDTFSVFGYSVKATPKAGYEFKSWSNIPTSNTITADKTITANFEIKKYSVTVNAAAGGTVSRTSAITGVSYGSTIAVSGNKITVNGTSVTASASTGYEFASWSVSNGYSVSGDVTVTANFRVKTYKVTVSSNSTTKGTVSMSEVTNVPYNTQIAVNGNKINVNGTEVTANPKSGYAFDKWSVSNGAAVTGNITVTASWKNATYNITFKDCGNASMTYDYSTSSSTKTLTQPSKTGYLFNDWTVESGNATVSKNSLKIAARATGDIVVRANWAQAVGVTYNYNGGSGNTASVTDKSGTKVTLPTASRNGYTFNGWFTASTGGNEVGDGGSSYTLSATTTLYAQWTIKEYTIKLDQDGGSGAYLSMETYTISTVDQTVTINGTSKKDGKDFEEWEIDTNSSGKSSSLSGTTLTIPAGDYGDITIKASWSGGGSCFASGTLITLADGTKKPARDITYSDKLLSFNHFTGQYESADVLVIVKSEENVFEKCALYFDDGSNIEIINMHGLFDIDENKYVIIGNFNADEYLGHRFVKYDEKTGKNIAVTLCQHKVVFETDTKYAFLTVRNINLIGNGLLTMCDEIEGLYNIFEYDENLVYDAEDIAESIAEYGISPYEEWQDYFTYEQYLAFELDYADIAEGKGLTTKKQHLETFLKYYDCVVR